MPEAIITFIKGDKAGSETDYRDALPVNMTAVMKKIFGVDGYMIQQPGLTLFGSGPGSDRGGNWNERFAEHIRVSGSKLIKVSDDGVVTEIGSIAGTKQASMPYSFNTQAVISGGNMYLYSPSAGLSQVSDPDLGSPIDGDWIDGYYFLTDGEFIYHTDIDDETAIDPLKFATAEFSPDPTLAVLKTQDNKIMVFGRYSIEYFVNAAQENFAFQRVPTRAIKAGLVGTHCKTEMSGGVYILGGRKEEQVGVHLVGVGSISKVSSREVDKILGQYKENELSDVVMESRVEDGYYHMIIHLPNETLLFNENIAKTQGIDYAWSYLNSGDILEEYRAINGVHDPRVGKMVYGDKFNGNIGLLDETVATQYGQKVGWSMYTPYIYLETASIDELEIEIVPGFTGSVDDAVFVSMTYDGVTDGTREATIRYGQKGQHKNRFITYRWGYVEDWFAFKLRGLSDTRVAFSKGTIVYG